MKKLMVTVVGAAAALGAFAGNFDFESLVETNLFNDVSYLNTTSYGTCWLNSLAAGSTTTNEFAVTAAGAAYDGGYGYPAFFPANTDPSKALSVKTKFGEPLEFLANGGSTTNIGDGLYFDSLVKFTVCDEGGSNQTYADKGAKIVMWLEENGAATNLLIRAGYLTESNNEISSPTGGKVYTNTTAGVGLADDAWHRVTIKAIANITERQGCYIPGFVIFIDGEVVGVTDSKWGIANFDSDLTYVAASYNTDGALFPSMVPDMSGQNLTSAGFDGTGSINTLSFTDTAPSFAVDPEPPADPGANIVITGGTQPSGTLATFADVVAAANNAGSGATVAVTLTKGFELSEPVTFSGDAAITLDFAGFVITNTVADAIITNSANLTITDTDVGGGIYCVESEGYALVQTATGALYINAGNIDGLVDTSAATAGSVTGGAFRSSDDLQFAANVASGTLIAEGKALSQTANADGLYEIVDAEPEPETGYEAQVNSGTKYETLQAAVNAATAGDTVTVLKDCNIATPLSITKNLTIHNDHTITGSVNYAICIGATVSFEGSGKVERASGITGSAFCVGANETTRGAITAGTAGTLNFDGLTVCGGSGGNLIKLENGTVNMNGGVLRDGKRGIKADADVGNFTSAIVINGGTITNNTDCAIMASAASANGTATVVVNGGVIAGSLVYDGTAGTHSITIPGTSTAKFDDDQSAFCAAGYETNLSDGWYVVTASWDANSSEISAGTTAATEYTELAGTALADADATKLTDWAKGNSVKFSAVTAAPATYVEAFILNCAPNAAAVAAAKEDFQSDLDITVNADGSVTIDEPAGDYNVTPQLKGSNNLTDWYNTSRTNNETYQFFKYVLSL